MKIAVVGAGIFGCVSALKLKEKFPNAKVVIFEKNVSILNSASGINQFRLHRGYHYPRSNETVQQVLESVLEFEHEFKSSICDVGFERYYAIAKEGSKVQTDNYLKFLEDNKLEYEISQESTLPLVYDNLDLVVKVKENGLDVGNLYLGLIERLRKSNIKILFNTKFTKNDISGFDVVINATYSNINHILPENNQQDYQFELVEKPVVSVGKEFQQKSFVIMDGDFCCIDPFGNDKYFHVMGHVKEAIHDTQIGKFYQIPSGYSDILNFGTLKTTKSRFALILNESQRFFKFEGKPVVPQSSKGSNKLIGNVYYQGSMFTVRTVLPNRYHDDARPSQIIKHDNQLYSIFGGKIGTSVDIANQLKEML